MLIRVLCDDSTTSHKQSSSCPTTPHVTTCSNGQPFFSVLVDAQSCPPQRAGHDHRCPPPFIPPPKGRIAHEGGGLCHLLLRRACHSCNLPAVFTYLLVVSMAECPTASETTSMGTPQRNRFVTQVWRKACGVNVERGSPASFRRNERRSLITLGDGSIGSSKDAQRNCASVVGMSIVMKQRSPSRDRR